MFIKKKFKNCRVEIELTKESMNRTSTYAFKSQQMKWSRRMSWFHRFRKEKLKVLKIKHMTQLEQLDLQWEYKVFNGVILHTIWQHNVKICPQLFSFGTWHLLSLSVFWFILTQSNVLGLTQPRMISISSPEVEESTPGHHLEHPSLSFHRTALELTKSGK